MPKFALSFIIEGTIQYNNPINANKNITIINNSKLKRGSDV